MTSQLLDLNCTHYLQRIKWETFISRSLREISLLVLYFTIKPCFKLFGTCANFSVYSFVSGNLIISTLLNIGGVGCAKCIAWSLLCWFLRILHRSNTIVTAVKTTPIMIPIIMRTSLLLSVPINS